MPVPSDITVLSTTAASNSPPGSETPSGIDDYLRSHAAFIAQMRAVIGGTVDANIPNAAATSIAALGTASTGTLTTSTTDTTVGRVLKVGDHNLGVVGFAKNKIINGSFVVNQRAVSGTVVLAAGVYGHDRFKAGASGCTYTFATSAGVTTLTITAGSLQQVIEGVNMQGGTHTLSWTGTAQGKIGGGSYAASGVTGSATGGANLTVEFNTGTLSLVQLEIGSIATPFDHRPIGQELALCQRYYWRGLPGTALNFNSYTAGYMTWFCQWSATMRAVPTLTSDFSGATLSGCSAPSVLSQTVNGCRLITNTSTAQANAAIDFLTTNYIAASAEL